MHTPFLRRRGCQKANQTLFPNFNLFIMKKILFFSLNCLIISFLGSCGKKDYTSIEGQVLEKGSNKGIANAKVIFSECVPGDGFGASAICLDIETVLTNAQGKYILTKEKDDATYYRIRAEKNNYGKPVEVFQTANAGEKSKNLNFTLPAFAWIKFHVKNVNPFDDSDYIAAPGASGGNLDYRFYGKTVDTTYILGGSKYPGGFNFGIDWTIIKNNKQKEIEDSIFFIPLDTVYYKIKY